MTPTWAELLLRVETWRQWAQFVYLGGGQAEGTDEELRRMVCAGYDAYPDVLAALKATRGQWIHSVNAEQCLAAIAKAEGRR